MTWTTGKLLAAIGDASPTECITEARMAELTSLTAKQVENSCDRLRRHGFIKRTGKGCHKLTDAGLEVYKAGGAWTSGPKGPQETGQRHRDPGLRQRAWNALRLGRKMTLDDIVMLAVEGEEKAAYDNVRKYVRALARGGYLFELAQREAPLKSSSNGCKRFMLKPEMDTGPEAPVWRVSRDSIYDPNLDRETKFADVAEAA